MLMECGGDRKRLALNERIQTANSGLPILRWSLLNHTLIGENSINREGEPSGGVIGLQSHFAIG